MEHFSIFNWQKFGTYLFRVFLILMLCLIAGCSSENSTDIASGSSETGSATFSIAWHRATDSRLISTGLVTAKAVSVPCDLIDYIDCIVYDASGNDLASATFDCTDHQGTIDSIPVGEDRIIVILGWDIFGGIRYHGEIPGVTIEAGQTNDLGVIDVYYPFFTTLELPEDGSEVPASELSFQWTGVEDAYEYNILVATDSEFNAAILDTLTPDTTFTPSAALDPGDYYWMVLPVDAYSNYGPGPLSGPWSFSLTSDEGCTYTLDPTDATFEFDGGDGSFTVTAPEGCNWSASESEDWIEITSGESGSGDGTVRYSVSENPTENTRTATITVEGQTHRVTQNPVEVICTYTLDPTDATFEFDGGDGSFTVTAPEGCSWSASESVGWIEITSGASGSGDGTVRYSVSENTGGARTATITIYDETHTVYQDPAPSSTPPFIWNPAYLLTGLNKFYYDGMWLSTFDLSFQYSDPDGDANAESGAVLLMAWQFNNSSTVYEQELTAPLTGINGYEGTVIHEIALRFWTATNVSIDLTLFDGAGNESNTLHIVIEKPEGAN